MSDVAFRTIDLERHEDVAVRFQAHTTLEAYGETDRFYKGDPTVTEYRNRLRGRVEAHPRGQVHVWIGEDIVGQIEVVPTWPDLGPGVGYVCLCYLAPKWRRSGLGDESHRYVVSYLESHGCHRARLCVSKTNARAIRYYEKHGWVSAGQRPGLPDSLYMERELG